MPNEILVDYLLNFLKDKYPNALKERFDISEINDKENVLHQIANKRKLVDATGQDDLLRAEVLLLKEFKDGLLGKIT